MTDTAARSFTKAISWKIMGSVAIFGISAAFVPLKTAAIIGSAGFIVNLLLYYLHERLWEHIQWGQKAPACGFVTFSR